VYLHGNTADKLSASKGPYGYIASDVMNNIPETISCLTAQNAFLSPHVYRIPHTELL
jgi:hypothetical protein